MTAQGDGPRCRRRWPRCATMRRGMPPPFLGYVARRRPPNSKGSIAASTAGRIGCNPWRDQVDPRVCQQTITNRYPFVRGSTQEVPLGEISPSLFSPNGIMDKFLCSKFPCALWPIRPRIRDWGLAEGTGPVGRSLSAGHA